MKQESNLTAQQSEKRSQRKQILITPTMDKQTKLLGQIRGISFNELVNNALIDYVQNQMKDENVKTAIEILSKTSK